jgi:hypothetical protein
MAGRSWVAIIVMFCRVVALGAGTATPAGEEAPVKWSQPPLAIDLNVDPNAPQTFCAYYQSSKSTVLADGRRVWNMVVDDFRGLGPMPVTGLRWWGFYKGWTEPEPPAVQPLHWLVTFWVNRPEPADESLFPEIMVWRLDIPAERVRIEPAGMDDFPHRFSEMCFRHELALEPNEWFRQGQFTAEQDLYWVGVAAVYPEGTPNKNLWGWATRPEVWRDPGQIIVMYGDGPGAQTQLWPGTLLPVTSSDLCGRQRGYDIAFELLTAQPWVKWDQPFDGLRAWPPYEDLESQGILNEQQENIGRLVADDWTSDGHTPVLAIAWWGSYIGYGHEACRCLEQPEPPRPDYFLLTLWTSVGPDREADYARPSEVVWQCRAFAFDEVLVGYDRNPAGEPNEPVYRYSVRLPAENWFRPQNAGNRYWFSVAAVYTDPRPLPVYSWGWTNHPQVSGAGATFIDYRMATRPQWGPLRDPQGRPVGMSFTFFTEPEEFESILP